MSDPDFDALIDSMYRGPRAGAAEPAEPLPVPALAGTTRDQRAYVPDAARATLLAALRAQPQPLAALSTAVGRCPRTVQTYLWRMQASGAVANNRGVWRLAG